ncbi:MAG TPA: Dabb family protein [Pyrinomonadaceae bacterium]
MLTHIVVWKYKPEVGEEQRREHVARLRALAGLVPEIQSFAVGRDVLGLPRSYHTGLVATFRDRDALRAYDAHPEHQSVAQLGRGISEHVASVDFEDD